MKKNMIISVITMITCFSAYAQENIEDNGLNLVSTCPPEVCNYMAFSEPIYFPYKDDLHWEIKNFEVALKKSGTFLSTGDLYVYGIDTALIVSLKLVFFSPDGDQIASFSFPEIQFYNEKTHAEPIVLVGNIEEVVTELISYFDIKITASERLPYYELSEDCYLPCKEHKLKEAIKKFKKSK